MQKFKSGNRVRIKGGNWQVLTMYFELHAATGTVIGSNRVIGWIEPIWTRSNGAFQSIQTYRIKLDSGTELDDIIEDCLEMDD